MVLYPDADDSVAALFEFVGMSFRNLRLDFAGSGVIDLTVQSDFTVLEIQ